MALMAASASGPIAETTMEVPGPADSIISPMIEVPPTVSLPLVTQTSALKRSTICTNFAEARACRPRLLMMGSSRDTAPVGNTGPGTVFRRRGVVAHLPARTRLAMVTYLRPASWAIAMASGSERSSRTLASLTSIGRLIPASTSTFGRLMQEIARLEGVPPNMSVRMATPSPRVDAVDRFDDVASAQIGIVFGSDRDRFDLLLWTHDVFERRLELVGKAPMGHKY